MVPNLECVFIRFRGKFLILKEMEIKDKKDYSLWRENVSD